MRNPKYSIIFATTDLQKTKLEVSKTEGIFFFKEREPRTDINGQEFTVVGIGTHEKALFPIVMEIAENNK